MNTRYIALDANAHPTDKASRQHVITRDTRTDLEWASASTKRVNHKAAMSAAEALDLAGAGWRAPTREELIGITDITRHAPAFDAEAFSFLRTSWYWSSDLAAWSSASAWFVNFTYGYVGYVPRSGDGFALAVRILP